MKTYPLTPEEDRARLVLRRIMSLREMSAAELSRRVGVSAQTISAKTKGLSVIGLADMHRFGKVLEIPPDLFLTTPDAAARWVLDNAPNQREAGYATLALTAAVVGIAALTRMPAEIVAGIAQIAIAENQCDDDVMSGEVEITLPLAA